jgi:DNA-binding SARP family transcriptional activator
VRSSTRTFGDLRRRSRIAAHAPDDRARLAALQRATDSVTGEPFAGAAYEWAEAVRENLRRRAVDALGEFAILQARSGDDAGALHALERARALDPYCEDVYRRLMCQLVDMGRHDAALRVYRELELRVAELGVEPEEETEALMADIRSRYQAPRRPPSYRQIFPKSEEVLSADDEDGADDEPSGFAAHRTVIRRGGSQHSTASRLERRDQTDLPILDSDDPDI